MTTEEETEQLKTLISESMIAGAEAASIQQIHADESRAWDEFVCSILPSLLDRVDRSILVASTVTLADALLEERRKRFNLESHRESLLAAKPAKAELRSIR
jgi:nucleoside recognition membrane protein YjiH